MALSIADRLDSMPIGDLAVKKTLCRLLKDDSKKSKSLQGHISKNIMDDTFLINAE